MYDLDDFFMDTQITFHLSQPINHYSNNISSWSTHW